MHIEHKTATLDGKPIAFTNLTQFQVQVGRYSSSYKPHYTFTGSLAKAVAYYNAINIGRGYKKRLIMVGANKPVLARAFS